MSSLSEDLLRSCFSFVSFVNGIISLTTSQIPEAILFESVPIIFQHIGRGWILEDLVEKVEE